MFYQMIALNVAVNSGISLFVLLLSNQFLELKGNVFKKFSKLNVFQLTCSDVVERFHLVFFLFLIAIRNLAEIKENLTWAHLFTTLFVPLGVLLFSEILIDWLKHAFITKFNNITLSYYDSTLLALAKDLAEKQTPGAWKDRAPIVATRRIGFEPIPLACLVRHLSAPSHRSTVFTDPFFFFPTVCPHHPPNISRTLPIQSLG